MYGDWPTDPRLQAEWGKAWADDLEWFSQEIISKALTTWRRTETRRPTPAAIIKLCRGHLPTPKTVEPQSRPRPEITEDAKARNRELIASAFPELRRMMREID